MSEQDNVKIVQSAYDNFKSGNIQGLLGLFSEDIQWELPVIENVSFSGMRRGRDQVGQFFAAVNEQQEALLFEPQDYIAQAEKVVALGHYVWRVKATGKKSESDFAHVFTIREGRIVGFKEFTDTAASAAAYRK